MPLDKMVETVYQLSHSNSAVYSFNPKEIFFSLLTMFAVERTLGPGDQHFEFCSQKITFPLCFWFPNLKIEAPSRVICELLTL